MEVEPKAVGNAGSCLGEDRWKGGAKASRMSDMSCKECGITGGDAANQCSFPCDRQWHYRHADGERVEIKISGGWVYCATRVLVARRKRGRTHILGLGLGFRA